MMSKERKTRRGFQYGQWQVKDNVLASALPYAAINKWRKQCPGAYNAALAKGWLDEATSHMQRRTTWTDDMLLRDAARYLSPSTWKAASASAYATARNRDLLAQCCAHMTRTRMPAHYWTREKCLESARRFQTIVEWTQQDGGALDAAFRQGWYQEAIAHMVEIVSFGEYCIRRFLMSHDIAFECEWKFEDLKVKRHLRYDFYVPRYNLLIEYHGEQHFVEKESRGSRVTLADIQAHDRMKVDYARDNGIPLLVISSVNVQDIESQVRSTLDALAGDRPGAGLQEHGRQLGEDELDGLATYGRWNKNEVLEDALLYQQYSDWTGTYSYQLALKRGWLEEASAHMDRNFRGHGYWTPERLKEDAAKYRSRKAWQKAPASGYAAAYARKLIDEVAPHLQPLRKKWTLEACQAAARPYKSRKEWAKHDPSGYNAALRKDWLKSCCVHMEWRSTKPQERYASEHIASARSDKE